MKFDFISLQIFGPESRSFMPDEAAVAVFLSAAGVVTTNEIMKGLVIVLRWMT